eukprot:gene17443-19188_t
MEAEKSTPLEQNTSPDESITKEGQVQEQPSNGDVTEEKIKPELDTESSVDDNQQKAGNAKEEIPDDETKNKIETSDTEEGGYRSDQSCSDEESGDNIIENPPSKGSSGYDESDDYEEEYSEVSEGQRGKEEDEEKEYDEGVSDNGSSDDVMVQSSNEHDAEGYEEDREDESTNDKEDIDEKDPRRVPRRTGFWEHDSRLEEITVDESRAPKSDRKLWDKIGERWQHDKYNEVEQAPKESWEIEEAANQGRGQDNRRRNQRNLGDFMRGTKGGRGGRSSRGRRGDGRSNNEDRRGQSTHSRGSPRGRADFRGRRRESKPKDEEQEYEDANMEWGLAVDESNDKRDANRGKVKKESKEKIENQQDEEKNQRDKLKSKESKKQSEPSTSIHQQSKPSPPKKEESAEEQHLSRGRGRGITSKKISSAKKTAVDFSKKERKRSKEQPIHQDEENYKELCFSDADENEQAAPESAQSKHTAKPKRYSSQRQKQSLGTEAAPQNPAAQNPANQEVAFDPNMLMFLQQQLQQMQLMQQQQQQPVQQQQQQPVAAQAQGSTVVTPSMQQILQHQFLNMQNLQQMYTQQQQQQQQQMQSMRMRQPSIPSNEPQTSPAVDANIMMPRNQFPPNAPPNVQHYNLMQQNQPGLYSQTGTQFSNQMMSVQQQPTSQQPGLFIPAVQQVATPQQVPDESAEQFAQRKARPAAIPIKPPPEPVNLCLDQSELYTESQTHEMLVMVQIVIKLQKEK